MNSANPIFETNIADTKVRTNIPEPQAPKPQMPKPQMPEEEEYTPPLIPTPEDFPLWEGMTRGQAHAQTKLRNFARFVQVSTDHPLSEEEMIGGIHFFYGQFTNNPTASVGDITEDLLGERVEDTKKAFQMIVEHAKNIITFEPIIKYKQMTEEERGKAVKNLMREKNATQAKYKVPEGYGTSPWNLLSIPDGEEVKVPEDMKLPEEVEKKINAEIDEVAKTAKDEGRIFDERMRKNLYKSKREEYLRPAVKKQFEKQYENMQYANTAPIALQVAGKRVSPDTIDFLLRTGLFEDKEQAKEFFLAKYGAKDTPKYRDYEKAKERREFINKTATVHYGLPAPMPLPPMAQATALNTMTVTDKKEGLKIQNVLDSQLLMVDDTTYASMLQAINAVQGKKEEGGWHYFGRSTFSVIGDKWHSIKMYVTEGQGYDIWHTYDNSTAIVREMLRRTDGDEDIFNPDGSVKSKYKKDAIDLLMTRNTLKDSQNPEETKPIGREAWLDHGLHDYWEVGKANMLYERRVRNLDSVITTDYTGTHAKLLQEMGAIMGTLVDMVATGAMASIPIAGLPLALGSLYASEQYQLETQALDAGVPPTQARFWSSVYSLPYAISEYAEVKALSPKAWRPVLEDIGMSPKLLHKSVLVGLGIKTEQEAFTKAELKLLNEAKNFWGFMNYIKITANETGEEYLQAGLEYGFWATLALSNPDNINLPDKQVQMFKQMLEATIIMPFVTFAGMGIARMAYGYKSQTFSIDQLNNLSRDQALLYLANNSVAQHLEGGVIKQTLNELKEVPPTVRKAIESVFPTMNMEYEDVRKEKNKRKGKMNWRNAYLESKNPDERITEKDIERIQQLGGVRLVPEMEGRPTGEQYELEGEKKIQEAWNKVDDLKAQLEELKTDKENNEQIKNVKDRIKYLEEKERLTKEIEERSRNLYEPEKDKTVKKLKKELQNLEKTDGASIEIPNVTSIVELKKKLETLQNEGAKALLEREQAIQNEIEKAKEEAKELVRKNDEDTTADKLFEQNVEDLRGYLLRQGYTNPDEIIYSVRRMLQMKDEIIQEAKTQLKQQGIELFNSLISGESEIKFISPHTKMAPAERLHQIFKRVGSDVELDIVETTKEASEKYGWSAEELENKAGFFENGTIVLITENITNEEHAERTYLHEVVHSSKEFEQRIGYLTYSAVIDMVEPESDEELIDNAKALLKSLVDITDEELDALVVNGDPTKLFAELGAEIVVEMVSGEEIGVTTSELFDDIVTQLQKSDLGFVDVKQYLEVVALASKGVDASELSWDLTKNIAQAQTDYLIKRMIEELTGKDLDSEKDKSIIELALQQRERVEEARKGERQILNDLIEKLQQRAEKEGWSEEELKNLERELKARIQGHDILSATFDSDIDSIIKPAIQDIIEGIKESYPNDSEEDIKEFILFHLSNMDFKIEGDDAEIVTPDVMAEHIIESMVEDYDNMKKNGITASRVQALNPLRETAIRVANLRKEGKMTEADELLANQEPAFVKQVNDYVSKIENESESRSIRQAESIVHAKEVMEKMQSRIGLARRSATLNVLSDSKERVIMNRNLRRTARRVLSSTDIRRFNTVEEALALNDKLDEMVANHAPRVAMEKVVEEVFTEHLKTNEEEISNIVDRMRKDTMLEDEAFEGTTLESPAGIAVSRELLKSFINEFKKYTPTRSKLINKVMSQSWRADTQEDLVSYASEATLKIAYRPVDQDAKIALSDLFRMAKTGSRNVAWFKRPISGDNLKKVLHWKKLANMTKKDANEYILKKSDKLDKLTEAGDATFEEINNARNELVEAQKFAGLKQEAPSAWTDAIEYADEQLDPEAQREAQLEVEKLQKKKDSMLKAVKGRKGGKLVGLNSLNFYDVLRSIFGQGEEADAVISEIRDTVDMGTMEAREFMLKYGSDEMFSRLSAKTGIKIPKLHKMIRKMSEVDSRFDGAVLGNKDLQLSADEALNAYLAWSQEDVRSVAEVTFDMDIIRTQLTEFEKTVGDIYKEMYKASGEELAIHTEDKTGLRFVQVENYAPITVARERMASSGKSLKALVAPGSILERTKHSRTLEPKIGASQVFESHMADGAVFIGMWDATVLMNNTILSPEVLKATQYKYGDDAEKVLREFAISVATQRTSANASLNSENKILKFMLAMQIRPLFFNVRSAVRQASSLPLYGLENDVSVGKTIMDRLNNLGSSEYKELRDYIKNSAVMKERIGDALGREMSMIIGSEDYVGEGVMRTLAEKGLWMNKQMDYFTVMAVAPAILQNQIDRLNEQGAFGGDQEKVKKLALARTLGRINATQQSTQIAYRSYSHLQHGLMRSIMAPFTSTLQQYMSFEIRAYNVWKEAEGAEKVTALKELANIAFLNHMVAPILYTLLGQLFNAYALGDSPEDDEKKKEIFLSYLTGMLIGPLAGLFMYGPLLMSGLEFSIGKASGVKTFQHDILAGSVNEAFNWKKIYKDEEEFLMVLKDPNRDLKEVFTTAIKPLVPSVSQAEKSMKNYGFMEE